MKKISAIALIASSVFLLNGCLMSQFDQQNTQLIAQPKNIIEFTVIEGKTTKQEIINALGNPDDLSSIAIGYSYVNKPDDKLNLRIIQKDKTNLNIEVYGYSDKIRSVYFALDEKNVVEEVRY